MTADITTGSLGESLLQKLNSAGEKALQSARQQIRNIDHGLYADVPIRCKATECPYYDVCVITHEIDVNTIAGQPCPIEITEVIELYKVYQKEFNLMYNDSFSLRGLIKDLVDKEIQIRRADKYISMHPEFLDDITEHDKFGNETTRKEVAKQIEYKEKLLKRKGEILQLLNATPKDKAGMKLTVFQDPSTLASELLTRYQKQLELADKPEEVIYIGTEEQT